MLNYKLEIIQNLDSRVCVSHICEQHGIKKSKLYWTLKRNKDGLISAIFKFCCSMKRSESANIGNWLEELA